LLLEAKNAWKAGKEEFISIYSSCAQGGWRLITYRPKRPLSSIILDVGIKEKILDDAKDFLKSKKWYTERGIPFRRGYLLVSPPKPLEVSAATNSSYVVRGSWFWENLDNPESGGRTWA